MAVSFLDVDLRWLLMVRRCDIAVPGNRECGVESKWLLRGKQIAVLVMAVYACYGSLWQKQGFANSQNIIDQRFEVL